MVVPHPCKHDEQRQQWEQAVLAARPPLRSWLESVRAGVAVCAKFIQQTSNHRIRAEADALQACAMV